MSVIGIASINYMINNHKNVRLPQTYVNALFQVGATPLVIPVINDETYLTKIISQIDGLVIPGGDDVNPNMYHEEVLPYSEGIDDELDSYQYKLISLALKQNLPILGICRGHQMLNVVFNGSLYQDISYVKRTVDICHSQLKEGYSFNEPVHEVVFKQNSILHNLYGDKMMTNSFHHQMIKDLGKDLVAIGHTEDGIVEAIYHPNYKFVLGVQWHPERSSDQLPLFELFNEVCRSK